MKTEDPLSVERRVRLHSPHQPVPRRPLRTALVMFTAFSAAALTQSGIGSITVVAVHAQAGASGEVRATVSGRLLNAAGQPTTGGTVQLLPRAATVPRPLDARITDDGLFEFRNVPAGKYVIRAYRGRQNAATEGEFGALLVSVDERDVTGVVVTMSRGSSIRGFVTVNNIRGAMSPNLTELKILPVPVDVDFAPANLAEATVRADGSFELNGITGERRLQVTKLPAGWSLKRVLVGNMDRTNQPLTFGQPNQSLMNVQIILTDAGTEGVAQRPQFEVASIKANKNADAAQNARVLAGGRIEITNMPVRTLVRVAFGVTGPQVVGGPS